MTEINVDLNGPSYIRPTTDAHPDGYGWPPFGDAALLEAYERGRSAAAADIRAEAENTAAIEGGPDLMHYAAEIAEGTNHA